MASPRRPPGFMHRSNRQKSNRERKFLWPVGGDLTVFFDPAFIELGGSYPARYKALSWQASIALQSVTQAGYGHLFLSFPQILT
jgi:hypothetical protein